MIDLTYSQAIANAEHLIALDQIEVWIRDDTDFPYDKVCRVTTGSSYRLSGPTSCRLIVDEAGLTFSLSVDFEHRDANGRGASDFDRQRLRDLMLKLPPPARASFADMLEREVLPPMSQRAEEFRQVQLRQIDSEDCVRGLIAFARAEQSA